MIRILQNKGIEEIAVSSFLGGYLYYIWSSQKGFDHSTYII